MNSVKSNYVEQAPLSLDDLLVENLNLLLKEHNLTEAELARCTKIPQPTLHKILSGKTGDPRISTLKLIASFFNVTIDDLYETNFLGSKKFNVKTQAIPVISWSECLNAREFIANLDLASWSNWLVVEQVNGFLYGVSTKSSMEPRFPKGTILVVDSQASACDGDLVLVQYPNTQEATLRELVLDGPMKLLFPVNSHSEKQALTEDIHILGVVIQSRFNF